MMGSAVPCHSVPHPAEILLRRGTHTHNYYTWWTCIIQCHITVTCQLKICLLITFSFSFSCHLRFLWYATGDIEKNCLFSLKENGSLLCHPACSSLTTVPEYVSNDAVWRDWELRVCTISGKWLVSFAMLVFPVEVSWRGRENQNPFLGIWQWRALSLWRTTSFMCALGNWRSVIKCIHSNLTVITFILETWLEDSFVGGELTDLRS